MAALEPKRLLAVKNVVRYVGGAHIDTNTGKVNGSAFDRTLKDIDGLSFTQSGIFAGKQTKDDAQIRLVVGSRLKLGTTACFAQINVGEAQCGLTQEFDSEFFFQEDKLDAEGKWLANPAHALLMGLPFMGESVGSLRSELAGDFLRRKIIRTFPAVG
ncbi:MAG: hypothetical protein ABIQ66_05455 [Novosphingobium sp.]